MNRMRALQEFYYLLDQKLEERRMIENEMYELKGYIRGIEDALVEVKKEQLPAYDAPQRVEDLTHAGTRAEAVCADSGRGGNEKGVK